jgi:hypothetical protein
MRQLCRFALAVAAVSWMAVLTGPAAAAPYGVEVMLSWDDPGTPGDDSVSTTLAGLPTYFIPLENGGFYIIDTDLDTVYDPVTGTGAEPLSIPGVADIGWNSVWDEDPLVTNNLSVTNILPFAITIDVTVTAPVAPSLAATLMSGSVGVTLTEVAGPATTATVSTSGGIDLYRAFIDGVEVQDLLDDPFAPPATGNNDTDTYSDSFGIPIPIAGPGVASDIAIRIRAVLSAGDSLGVTSVFEVLDAPEPFALGLLGVALASALVVRRRA